MLPKVIEVSFKTYATNKEAKQSFEFLTLVKKRKLRWFGHISRSSGLAKRTPLGTVKGKRRKGRRRGGKTILRNGQEWTLLAQLGRKELL